MDVARKERRVIPIGGHDYYVKPAGLAVIRAAKQLEQPEDDSDVEAVILFMIRGLALRLAPVNGGPPAADHLLTLAENDEIGLEELAELSGEITGGGEDDPPVDPPSAPTSSGGASSARRRKK